MIDAQRVAWIFHRCTACAEANIVFSLAGVASSVRPKLGRTTLHWLSRAVARQPHCNERLRPCPCLACVGDLREAADHHVLWIAGDGGGRPDIRRRGHGQQVGHRPAPQRERQSPERVGPARGRLHHSPGRRKKRRRWRRAPRNQRRLACAMTQALATAKKPESRRLATTIITPSRSVMVSRLRPMRP